MSPLTLAKDMSYTCPGPTEMPFCNNPLSKFVWKCNQLPGDHCKWTDIQYTFSLGNEIRGETWSTYLRLLSWHNWRVYNWRRVEHLHIHICSKFRMKNRGALNQRSYENKKDITRRAPNPLPALPASSFTLTQHEKWNCLARSWCNLFWIHDFKQYLQKLHSNRKRRGWGKLALQSHIAIFSFDTSIAYTLLRYALSPFYFRIIWQRKCWSLQ